MKYRFAAIAAAVVLAPGAAMAAGTHTLTVTADVTDTCSFDAAGSLLPFGSIDPSVATNATATVDVTFHCSAGTAYTVTVPAGPYSLSGPGGATMDYTVALTGATGSGAGMTAAASTVTVDGTIVPAQFQNTTAGAYTGSLVLSINP